MCFDSVLDTRHEWTAGWARRRRHFATSGGACPELGLDAFPLHPNGMINSAEIYVTVRVCVCESCICMIIGVYLGPLAVPHRAHTPIHRHQPPGRVFSGRAVCWVCAARRPLILFIIFLFTPSNRNKCIQCTQSSSRRCTHAHALALARSGSSACGQTRERTRSILLYASGYFLFFCVRCA